MIVLQKFDGVERVQGILICSRFAILGLYLPAATLDPDAMLGLFRDFDIHTSVHMPAKNEPTRKQIQTLQETYIKHKCKISWDLNWVDMILQLKMRNGNNCDKIH